MTTTNSYPLPKHCHIKLGKLASFVYLCQAEAGAPATVKIDGDPELTRFIRVEQKPDAIEILSSAPDIRPHLFNRTKVQIHLPQESTFVAEDTFFGEIFTRRLSNTTLMIQHRGHFTACELRDLVAIFDGASQSTVSLAEEVFLCTHGHSSLKIDRADSATMLMNHSLGNVSVQYFR